MYWILSNELVDEDRDADLSGTTNIELGGALSFDQGEAVVGSVKDLTLTLRPDARMGRMTDHLSILSVKGLVFSSRLRELLRILSVDNIQYFDLKIVDPKSGQAFDDYQVANVVGHVDCVDEDKSDLQYSKSGKIRWIDKLVLDESKIPPDLKVFRLSKRKTAVVVHESIRNAMLSADITGCVFYKPENYS